MLATSTAARLRQAAKPLRLISTLEDHDDVQHMYANMDIADDMLAASARSDPGCRSGSVRPG